MSVSDCWELPNEGYVAVGPTSSSLAIVTEGDAPIRFITNSHEYAQFWNGVWRFDPIHTPSYTTGNSWLDSDNKGFLDVPWQNLVHFRKGVLATQTATVTIANTIVQSSLIGVGRGSTVLPGSFLTRGKTLSLRSRGTIADTGTPNITINLLFDATTIVSTGVVALTGLTGTTEWEISLDITYRDSGSDEVLAFGYFRVGNTFHPMLGTPISIDPTVNNTIDLTATWGTASPSNTMSSMTLVLEV